MFGGAGAEFVGYGVEAKARGKGKGKGDFISKKAVAMFKGAQQSIKLSKSGKRRGEMDIHAKEDR